jgi:hypothetical protein
MQRAVGSTAIWARWTRWRALPRRAAQLGVRIGARTRRGVAAAALGRRPRPRLDQGQLRPRRLQNILAVAVAVAVAVAARRFRGVVFTKVLNGRQARAQTGQRRVGPNVKAVDG